MKFTAIPCLIVAAALAGPSIAEEPDTGIEVTAPASVAAWSQAVSRELDRNIDKRLPSYSMKGGTPHGLASVRFRCSESGEPTAIELTRKSSDRRLNALARNVVADIKTLHPLPLGVTADQLFVANVLVASDQEEYDRHMATLRNEMRSRPNMAGKAPQPIALNAGVSPSG